MYNSATTTTVQDSVLHEHLYTAGSTPQVMALTPPLSSGGQLYGRYAVRFKSDVVPGYKLAWLLWPSSDDWSQGEVDFPEGDAGGEISGYAHDTTGQPSRNAWYLNTGKPMTSWHTAVIEWSPDKLTFILDGIAHSTTDPKAIPTHKMGWVLQTETQLSAEAPSPSVSGTVSIDWVAAWTRD